MKGGYRTWIQYTTEAKKSIIRITEPLSIFLQLAKRKQIDTSNCYSLMAGQNKIKHIDSLKYTL